MKKPIRSRRRLFQEDLEARNMLAGDSLNLPSGIVLDASNPEASVTVNVGDPAGYDSAAVILRVVDADFSDEGRLDINGRGQIELFGTSAGQQYDERAAELAFTTPTSWWHDGENVLTFSHIQSKYYQIQDVRVVLVNDADPIDVEVPVAVEGALHVYHPDDRDAPSGAMRSIKSAMRMLTAGDTLIVHAGVYAESFGDADIPGGESWDKPVTIQAEGNVVLRPPVGADRVFTLSHSNTHHVIIDGFVMDAINVTYEAVKITSGTGVSHDIWIRNSEIMNAPISGVLVNDLSQNNRFTNVHVHDNGRSGFHHGFYIASSNNIIEDSTIHQNSGWGVHVYFQNGTIANNIVRNNVVYDNGTSGRGFGIGLYTGPGHQAVANTLFTNAQGGIAYGYGTSAGLISANTVYDHAGQAEISATSEEKGPQTQIIGNTILSTKAPTEIPLPGGAGMDTPPRDPLNDVDPLPDPPNGDAGNEQPASSIKTLPISVVKDRPDQTVLVSAAKPPAVGTAVLTLTVTDADFADEGTLDINGRGQLSLFGPLATPELHHQKISHVTIETPADWWNDGANELRFQHNRTDGHDVLGISVKFEAGKSAVGASITDITLVGRRKRG